MTPTEHAQLPAGWVWVTFGDLLSEPLANGLSIKGSDTPPGVPALKLNAMGERGFDWSKVRYLPIDWDEVIDIEIQEGDFFISRGNGSLALVGRGTSVQKPAQRVIFPDTMIRARICEPIRSTGWVQTVWSCPGVREQIERRVKTTAGIWKISQGEIESIRLPIPPLSEQTRIVGEVEKQLTRLDAGVEALKRVQAQLKRYRASVLKAACEGRLVPTEAELARREKRDYEPADRVLAQNKVEIAVLGNESAPMPEGWCWTTIARTIEIIDYRGRTPPYSDAGIPHIRSSNVRDGRVVWENLRFVTQATYDQYMTRGIPRVGDLLFSTEAPLGELAPVPDAPFSLAQRLMVLRPDQRVWNTAFLMYQMMSPSFRARLTQRGTGSTVTGVSSRNFQSLPLAVPPLEEQQRIVSEIEARLSATSAAASMIDASIRRAGSLRYSVLKTAFEGSLVPQDPQNEPASKLLERISAAVENKPLPKQGRAKQATAVPKMKATR